jgi:hypothetical protein
MDEESRMPVATSGCRPRLNAESRPLASVPDDLLLRRLAEILGQSHRVEADLIAHIAEVDERRLWAREAFPSMFAWCTAGLHLSEGEAWLRLTAARASREHPVLLSMLADGRLHLSGIALLAPHLTSANREAVLARATHRTKRQIEELVAGLAPRPDAVSLVRRLPGTSPDLALADPQREVGMTAPAGEAVIGVTSSGMGRTVASAPVDEPGCPTGGGSVSTRLEPAPAPPASVRPLAPGRQEVQFTASSALREKLVRLQALMRSQVPDGDLGAVNEAAVTEKLERLEARRFGATARPRKDLSTTDTSPSSRRIPAAVRRAVHERDGGRCRYVDASGRRCGERHHLQYHHVHPFGLGGDHRPDNVRLMCAQHNAYLAAHDYGREATTRFRRSRGAATRGASGSPARAPGIATVASSATPGGPPRVIPRGP